MTTSRHQPGISVVIGAVGRFAVRRARAIVVLTLLCTLALIPAAVDTQYDDDVIKFLPDGDPEVLRFREIGARFQGLSVGIIGVEAESGDLFSIPRLRALRNLSRALHDVPGVGSVTSVTELRDVEEQTTAMGESVAVIGDLVGELPDTGDSEQAQQFSTDIRAKVLSRDHIRGALISKTGKASLVLCTIQPGANLKEVADLLKLRANELLAKNNPGLRLYFGGAPFIGAYVADGTRADMRRLFPFVAIAILFILLVTARSFPGAIIALTAVGICIAWTMGLMRLFEHKLTLVSSSLPVLLVALGSAYSIHLLARVFSNLDKGATDKNAAVLEAMESVGPPIAGAGITTALGFLSFQAMDIGPMRSFGLWMAGSTLLIVVVSLLAVPAACVVLPLKGRDSGRAPAWALSGMCGCAQWVMNRPRWTALFFLAFAGVSAFFIQHLTTNVDTRHLFEEGSPPLQAEDFFQEHLGGSRFLQVEIQGDIKDPLVLQQIDRFSALAAAQPGVSDVQSVITPMILAAGALSGEKRIPESAKATRAIAALVEEDPNLRLLVEPTWKHAIVQIKLQGFDSERSSKLAATLKEKGGPLCSGPRAAVARALMTDAMKATELQEVSEHIANLCRAFGVAPPPQKDLLAATAARRKEGQDKGLLVSVEKQLRADIEDDEMVYLREGAAITDLASKVHHLLVSGELNMDKMAALVASVATDEEKEDLENLRKATRYLLENQLGIIRSRQRSARMDAVLGALPSPAPQRLKADIARALSTLDDPIAPLPGAAVSGVEPSRRTSVDMQVSGYPMVYSGMVASVNRNQARSLALSFLLIVSALCWFFNSWRLGCIAAVPAGFTLLATFGTMGFFGIPMDVGTSMVSSVALGVGIDYAVHLLWKHGRAIPGDEAPSLRSTFEATGWGIVINALAVTAGFAILSFGSIMPMKYFGVLTALAMMGSACASLLLIPALVHWVRPANT